MDEQWTRTVRADEVGASASFTPVTVRGETLLLCRLPSGQVTAFASACPHTGQPLNRGQLWDGCIECPYHFYAYDPSTGRNTFPGDATDEPLRIHRVREDDEGWIWVGPRAAPPDPAQSA